MPQTDMATTEAVIIIHKGGEPVAMLRKNGTVQWFNLKPMGWGDFEQLLEPGNAHPIQ
jgi:hypothetical protein